jgi:succinate dehydrogenase / fumarate reductase iron-sulfur subunit
MQVSLRIERSDSATGESRLQLFELDVPETATLLDCLEEIKDRRDGTLAFRRSCREGICGSCAVRIDGKTALACRTRASELAVRAEPAIVSPLGNMPVVRDLVVDAEPMWSKLRAARPYLEPVEWEAGDGRESLVLAGLTELVHKESLCINCGACLSECDALSVSPDFLGPHALAKAMRFVGDPRDGSASERLTALSGEHGIWECTRCYLCNERCPKAVDPRDAICKLAAEAIERGIDRDPGARHARWFVVSARTTGWLRETELVPKTQGILASIRQISFALRLARKGKVPRPFPRHKARDLQPPRRLHKLLPEQDRRGARGAAQGERALRRIEIVQVAELELSGETGESGG